MRLDGTHGKKQIWRSHLRTWGLSEANALYWRKYLWHCWDFSAPLQWYGTQEIVCPLCYAPDCAVLGWNLAECSVTYVVTPVAIKQTSEKRLLLLIQVWLSVLIKYGTELTVALKVNEKLLDVESHSLMSVNRQKGTSPIHFLRNPTFSITSTTERLFRMSQITGGEKDFLKFLV